MMLRKTYHVNEIFTSVQGEGIYVGTAATFIRLQGCTVGCPWCDSGPLADAPELEEIIARGNVEALEEFQVRTTNGLTRNTWAQGGTRMNVSTIMDQVKCHHVIITGGEPTLYDLDGLIYPLLQRNCFVQLETSGQNDLKGKLKPDWLTWSPKPLLNWDAPYDLKMLADEVKWVVDDDLRAKPEVLFDTWDYMLKKRKGKRPYFVLMPEGSPPRSDNIDACLELLHGVQEEFQGYWRYSDRLQYTLKVR